MLNQESPVSAEISVEVEEVQTIKTIQRGKYKGKIIMNDRLFTPFLIGKIPTKFGFKYDATEDQHGYYEWFNKGGLTYINVPVN
tara:strand:- start:981 stop:1232 length:252 start_codon:yes stop_codon:yes gene_type:complete